MTGGPRLLVTPKTGDLNLHRSAHGDGLQAGVGVTADAVKSLNRIAQFMTHSVYEADVAVSP